MPYSTLDDVGNKTFEKIYNNALKEYKGDREKAARTAWAGIRGAGYRKNPDSGKWEKKSELAELSLTIVKASFEKKDQSMRFRAVASDTDKDLYDEQMTPELFRDFVDRIENEIPIPEQYKSVICEDDWCGGLPYPSIAHYRSAGGKNVPGEIDNVYVDGNRLKSTGILNNSDLGRAVFKALCDDLYNKKNKIEDNDPVRISIGFLDLSHAHIGQGMDYVFDRKDLNSVCPMCSQGIGGKKYLKGILVHEAFTRVPVNPRTEAEVMKSMGDEIRTKKDDAASIVGDLAESLVDKSKVGHEALTFKADGSLTSTNAHGNLTSDVASDGKTMKMTNADMYGHCYDPNTGGWNQECIEQVFMGHMIPLRNEMQYNDADHRPNMNDGKTASTIAKSDRDDYFEQFSVTKKEGDGEHPASHYLVVEDNQKPTTWHLRVKDPDGKINTRLLGAAHAALTKGYRGNKYEGPDSGKAMGKLHSLYNSSGLQWPGEEKKSMETKGKIAEVPMMESEEHREPFEIDEDELYPEVTDKETNVNPAKRATKGLKSPAGEHGEIQAYSSKPAKAYAGKETDAEEQAEENDGEEKMSSKKEKALVGSFKSLLGGILSLKSQGVMGDPALQAIQPLFEAFGKEVQRTLTQMPVGSGDLASLIQSAVAAANAPLMQELAVLRAQVQSGGQVSVNRSRMAVPQPRSISMTPFTAQAMKSQADLVGDQTSGLTTQKSQFAQIRNIARKSTGAS